MSKHSQRGGLVPKTTPLGTDLPELQQARALWQLNRFDESLALFDRAARKCPGNCLALTDAARAFGARRALDERDRIGRTVPAFDWKRNSTILPVKGVASPCKVREAFHHHLNFNAC